MRNIIIITILFFSYINPSQSQSISSGYYSSPKSKSKYIYDFFFNFENENTFKYISFSWEGSSFGIGKYEIKKDSLYLNFEKCERCGEERYLERIKGQSDSLKINVKIQFESHLMQMSCDVVETKQVLNSDENGYLNKTIVKNGRDLTLLFTFIGHDPVYIKVPKETIELKGTVILDDYWIYPANEKRVYKIIKTDKNSLKLYMTDENVKLQKISKEEVQKMILRYNRSHNYNYYKNYFL